MSAYGFGPELDVLESHESVDLLPLELGRSILFTWPLLLVDISSGKTVSLDSLAFPFELQLEGEGEGVSRSKLVDPLTT